MTPTAQERATEVVAKHWGTWTDGGVAEILVAALEQVERETLERAAKSVYEVADEFMPHLPDGLINTIIDRLRALAAEKGCTQPGERSAQEKK